MTHSQQECLHQVRECVKVTNCRCNCCRHVSPSSPFLDECFRQSPFNSRSKSSSPAEASSSTRAAFHGRLHAEVLPHTGQGENSETQGRRGALSLVLRPLELIHEFFGRGSLLIRSYNNITTSFWVCFSQNNFALSASSFLYENVHYLCLKFTPGQSVSSFLNLKKKTKKHLDSYIFYCAFFL